MTERIPFTQIIENAKDQLVTQINNLLDQEPFDEEALDKLASHLGSIALWHDRRIERQRQKENERLSMFISK